MQEHNYPDETLMAYADGELDDATAAELDQALARDPELLRRLALFTGTRDVSPPQAPIKSARTSTRFKEPPRGHAR